MEAAKNALAQRSAAEALASLNLDSVQPLLHASRGVVPDTIYQLYLKLHGDLLRLLRVLSRENRSTLSNVKVVDAAAMQRGLRGPAATSSSAVSHREKAAAAFPFILAVDGSLMARFADYFEQRQQHEGEGEGEEDLFPQLALGDKGRGKGEPKRKQKQQQQRQEHSLPQASVLGNGKSAAQLSSSSSSSTTPETSDDYEDLRDDCGVSATTRTNEEKKKAKKCLPNDREGDNRGNAANQYNPPSKARKKKKQITEEAPNRDDDEGVEQQESLPSTTTGGVAIMTKQNRKKQKATVEAQCDGCDEGNDEDEFGGAEGSGDAPRIAKTKKDDDSVMMLCARAPTPPPPPPLHQRTGGGAVGSQAPRGPVVISSCAGGTSSGGTALVHMIDMSLGSSVNTSTPAGAGTTTAGGATIEAYKGTALDWKRTKPEPPKTARQAMIERVTGRLQPQPAHCHQQQQQPARKVSQLPPLEGSRQQL